jgi:hypothetical protein
MADNNGKKNTKNSEYDKFEKYNTPHTKDDPKTEIYSLRLYPKYINLIKKLAKKAHVPQRQVVEDALDVLAEKLNVKLEDDS